MSFLLFVNFLRNSSANDKIIFAAVLIFMTVAVNIILLELAVKMAD